MIGNTMYDNVNVALFSVASSKFENNYSCNEIPQKIISVAFIEFHVLYKMKFMEYFAIPLFVHISNIQLI